ncbi:Predicted thioesterase [Saccharicrinis carchari]|uniref:Predicted thioesterase n=1 Tax=Saccharicrinis carchari TaxID=1168039 RepID=A0A521BD32_SACCC|nr:hotdog domain-containing protein [Saccharicrinis carchari]SMO44996.1 Predicted thioesterase [Saccharicrinis carchari]
MTHSLSPGLNLSQKYTITEQDLASTLKTSQVAYASTPSLIVLIEKVICTLIQDLIGKEKTTVSAEINMKHLIPMAAGEEVTCSVHLKFVEGNKLFFDFALFTTDEDVVAIGAHERAIVKKDEY